MPGFYKPEDRYAGKLITLGTRDEQSQFVSEDYIVDNFFTSTGTLNITFDTLDVGTSTGRPIAAINLARESYIVLWLPQNTPEIFVSYATLNSGTFEFVEIGQAAPEGWVKNYKIWVSNGDSPSLPRSYVKNLTYDVLGETTRSIQNKLTATISFRTTLEGGR